MPCRSAKAAARSPSRAATHTTRPLLERWMAGTTKLSAILAAPSTPHRIMSRIVVSLKFNTLSEGDRRRCAALHPDRDATSSLWKISRPRPARRIRCLRRSRRIAGRSTTPSPIMPRSSSMSRVVAQPVAHVKSKHAFGLASRRDRGVQARGPTSSDTHRRRRRENRSAPDRVFADVQRLRQRVEHGAVSGVHRMQRFERERNTVIARRFKQLRNAVA